MEIQQALSRIKDRLLGTEYQIMWWLQNIIREGSYQDVLWLKHCMGGGPELDNLNSESWGGVAEEAIHVHLVGSGSD